MGFMTLEILQKKTIGQPSPPRGCCNSIQALPVAAVWVFGWGKKVPQKIKSPKNSPLKNT